jgi:hypothetical protein
MEWLQNLWNSFLGLFGIKKQPKIVTVQLMNDRQQGIAKDAMLAVREDITIEHRSKPVKLNSEKKLEEIKFDIGTEIVGRQLVVTVPDVNGGPQIWNLRNAVKIALGQEFNDQQLLFIEPSKVTSATKPTEPSVDHQQV